MVKMPWIAGRGWILYRIEAVGAEFDSDFLLLDAIKATALFCPGVARHDIRIPGAYPDLEIGLGHETSVSRS
jgi:hypothetical protein